MSFKQYLIIISIIFAAFFLHWLEHHRDVAVYEVKMNEELSAEIRHLQYDVSQLYIATAFNFMQIQVHESWRLDVVRPNERLTNHDKEMLREYFKSHKRTEGGSSDSATLYPR
jgi:hypothetical protein